MSSDQASDLRRQGIAAAKANHKDQARQLLQQAIRLDPSNEAGWLWLASVAASARERRFALEKLLELNPTHDTARKALAAMEGEGTAPPAASATPPAAPGIKRLSSMGPSPEAAPDPTTAPPAPERSAPQVAARAAAPRAVDPRAGDPRTADPMKQPPGIPLPSADAITEAQRQAEALIFDYNAPLPADTRWVHKTRGRAGERAIVVLRLYIAAAVAGVLTILAVGGVVAVQTNDDIRGIVLGPSLTPTPSPTITPTPTPGLTATPSPTPGLTLTPSATVPINLPRADQFNLPGPTDVYPPILERPLLNAALALDEGNFQVALPTLQAERAQLVRFNPNPYYYEALALLQRGDPEEALNLLDEAESRLDETPNENNAPLVNAGYAEVFWYQAQEAREAGANASASQFIAEMRERAEAAIDGDPRIARPYILLARASRQQNDFDEALRILSQGLEVDALEANTQLIIERGETFFERGEYDLASYQGFLALYIDPTIEEAYQLRYRAAIAEGNPGQAVLHAQDYLFYYPGSTLAFWLLGDAHLAEGSPELALAAFNRGLAGDVEDEPTVDMLVARGQIYTDQARHDLARADFTEALNRASALDLARAPAIRALRMQAAYNDGRFQIALDDAELLIGTDVIPASTIQLIRARSIVDQEFPEGDRALLTDAVGVLNDVTDPDQRAIADEYTARAQFALGNNAAALNAIDSALNDAETGGRRFLRGQILEAQRRIDDAIREYEWVLAWSRVYPFSFRLDAEERLVALTADS
ncbi:MAG: tetratricopeptide repeat protein [Chloroflexi bacterium]|nr:tetratricopeptide repeat protein [Chloroflexota bacterium]